MSDPTITWEQVEALRTWYLNRALRTDVIDGILAANPPPWEPSEADVDAYCACWAGHSRQSARLSLIGLHARGWDIAPRRLDAEPVVVRNRVTLTSTVLRRQQLGATTRWVSVRADDLRTVLAQDWAVPRSDAYPARDRLRAAVEAVGDNK